MRFGEGQRQPECLGPRHLPHDFLFALGRAGQTYPPALHPPAVQLAVERDGLHHHPHQDRLARVGLARDEVQFVEELPGRPQDAGQEVERARVGREVIDDPALRDYARRVIHHDLFHMIDFHDGRVFNSDPRWEGLNDKGTQYGDGGRRLQAEG